VFSEEGLGANKRLAPDGQRSLPEMYPVTSDISDRDWLGNKTSDKQRLMDWNVNVNVNVDVGSFAVAFPEPWASEVLWCHERI